MYADREEAALASKQRVRAADHTSSSAGSSRGRSRSRSISLSPVRHTKRSPSFSPPRRGTKRRNEPGFDIREKELQNQLRRRAMMSKGQARRSSPRSVTRSPSPVSNGHRRTVSPERSRNRTGRSSLSQESRDDGRSPRGSDRAVERKKRRRGYDRPTEERGFDDDRRSRRSGYSVGRGDDSDDDEYDRRSRRRSERPDPIDDQYARRDGYAPYDAYYDRDSYYDRRPMRYPPPRSAYYDPYAREPYFDRRYSRSPSPPPRRRGRRATEENKPKTPDPVDYELRSIFCSQLAAKLGQRDLGEFFEEKLGDNTVRDVRIVTDKITGRSKGIGYVELSDEALVERALALSGSIIFGIPILVQKTDAARNRGEGASTAEAPIRPNMPQNGVPGAPIHLDPGSAGRVQTNQSSRLYVGSLHFNLTENDVQAVFEPFGEIDNVDLHREPGTMKSKGFAFVQFKKAEDAEKAIEHMNGFELAGRPIRVGHVNSRGQEGRVSTQVSNDSTGAGATVTTSFDEGGGGGLNAQSRAALMQKLARTESSNVDVALKQQVEQQRPASIPETVSRAVLLKNMFNPEEETERGWDQELSDDVKEECEVKYGQVQKIHVDSDSNGDIWVLFNENDGAKKAIAGLNGRFFGGRSITATFVSEGIMNSVVG